MNTNESFLVFHASSTSPSFLIDTTIVVTARMSQTHFYVGEYFTLFRNNEPGMDTGVLKLNGSEIHEDVLKLDLKFILDEAFQFALAGFRTVLKHSHPPVNELSLSKIAFDFVPVENIYLARLWMRNEFHLPLQVMLQRTQCNALQAMLNEVRALPVIAYERHGNRKS